MSVLGGLGTSNGTWAFAGGHLGIWKKDTVRYIGFAGLASANLDYYTGSQSAQFNIEGQFLLQDLRFRLADSSFFLGGRYFYNQSETRFDGPDVPEAIGRPPWTRPMRDSGRSWPSMIGTTSSLRREGARSN